MLECASGCYGDAYPIFIHPTIALNKRNVVLAATAKPHKIQKQMSPALPGALLRSLCSPIGTGKHSEELMVLQLQDLVRHGDARNAEGDAGRKGQLDGVRRVQSRKLVHDLAFLPELIHRGRAGATSKNSKRLLLVNVTSRLAVLPAPPYSSSFKQP